MTKRRKLFFITICCILKTGIVAQEIQINEAYKDYVYTFEKLTSDEILSYEFNRFTLENKEYTFKVFADNVITNEKRLLGYWYAPYAAYHFSQDRKSLVFFEYTRGQNYPLFLLDGNLGTVKYLMQMNTGAMTDRDLKYLIYNSGSLDPPVRVFTLIDLEKMQVVRTITWIVYPREGGGCRIFRSLDSAYDFRIDYYVERVLYATCYYSIRDDQLNIALNDTTSEEIEVKRQREPILKEELVLY
jgi:hypothetical protein